MTTDPALTAATDTFRSRLVAVTEAQLQIATPCEGWTVRDLIVHVIGGNNMAVALIGGCSVDEARSFFASAAASDDVIAACAASLDAQLSALGSGIDMGRTVHHPIGDIPAAQLVDFRIGDLVVHSWDLARATGTEEHLPEDLVARVYGALEPMAPVIGSIGVFGSGPSGTVATDTDMQTRLLDLTGRRP